MGREGWLRMACGTQSRRAREAGISPLRDQPASAQLRAGSGDSLPDMIHSEMRLYNRKSLYASQLSREGLSRVCKMFPLGQPGPGREGRGCKEQAINALPVCLTQPCPSAHSGNSDHGCWQNQGTKTRQGKCEGDQQ